MSKVSRDDKAHTANKRPKRIPLGQGSKLSLAERYVKKGFHHYLFLDKPGELESAQAAYYEFVKDENGDKVKMPAGNGLNHYLMCIPKKLYDEDMAAQQKMVTETTRQNVRVNQAAGNYSPEGHDSVVTRDI